MRNYRGRFPFRLATTSYIDPDEIVPNVKKLAPSFDEIELVLFESRGDSLPDDFQISELMRLFQLYRVGFNIHLPIDIFLGDEREEVRLRGISIVKQVMERTRPLNPGIYTLHLDLREARDINSWRRRVIQSLERILAWGGEPNRISIETLDYPFEWIEDTVKEFGFSICLDIGHILSHGQDLNRYFERYLSNTSIIHLHGFNSGRDHLGIERLGEEMIDHILFRLRNYTGILSIEVFSLPDLKSSLDVLEQRWERTR